MTVAVSLNAETGRIEKGGRPLAAEPGARNGASTAVRNFKESLESHLDGLNTGGTIADNGLRGPEESSTATSLSKSKDAEAGMPAAGSIMISAKMLRLADSSASVEENALQDSAAAGALPAGTDTKALHASRNTSTNISTHSSTDVFMIDPAESSLRFGTERVLVSDTGASKDAPGQHSVSGDEEDRNKSSQPVSTGDTSALQFAQTAICAVPVCVPSADARCEASSAKSSAAMKSGSVVPEPSAAGRELHAHKTSSSISGSELKGQIQTIAPSNAPGTLPINIGQNQIQQGELQDEPQNSVSTILKISTDSVSGSREPARLSAAGNLQESAAGSQTTLATGQSAPVMVLANGERVDTHAVSQELSASDGVRSAGADANTFKPPQSDAARASEAASSIHLARHNEAEAARYPMSTELRKTFERDATEAEPVSIPGTLHVAEIARAGSAQVKADSASPGGDTAEAFAALDSGTSSGSNSADWPRPGHIHAEAGYRDPTLGWVGVRAESVGGAVHATLIPPSAEAAQALSEHLTGLHTFLANNHTPVQTLTMAASGGGEGQLSGQGSGSSMQQNSGQHADGGNSAEQAVGGPLTIRSSAGSGDSMIAAPSELLTRNMSGTGFTGGHISVRV